MVDVTAESSSDIQDFSLNVSKLATKEIVQSGTFTSKTEAIATGDGQLELAVGSETFLIDYTSTTTLDDLKNLINTEAGDSVDATVLQVGTNDFRLVLSAANTGTGQAISITDVVGEGETLKDALKPDPDAVADPSNLVDGMTNVQTAIDAEFTFNGVDITRTSNKISDLLAGVTLTLKETGTTNVSVEQDRENIETKITNFVDKYNSAMYQLTEDTKSSQDVDERGIFSSDSTMKSIKTSLVNMLSTVGEDQGKVQDYGLSVGEDGRLSLDMEVLGAKLDDDPTSVQAFFVGGTFTKDNDSTVEMTGIFAEMETEMEKYSKYNTILDQYKESMTTRFDSLEEQRVKAVERLNVSYAIQAKKFAAYDLIISKFNTASDMFTQMINAEIAARS